MSSYFKVLREIQRNSRRMKFEYEPLSKKEISGETILRSLLGNEGIGSIINKVISKCINRNGDNLLISLPRFCSMVHIYRGYLSHRENLISAVNFLYHLEDFTKEFDFKEEFDASFKIRRRSKDNEIDYLEFLNYFLAVTQMIEYYIPIDIAFYKGLSKSFSKDKDLKKFCDIINVLLDAIDRGDASIDAAELSQLIAA